MSIISQVFFGIGGLFALLAIAFYIYGRIAKLGDLLDEVPELLRQIQTTLDTKLDSMNIKLDSIDKKIDKKLGKAGESSNDNKRSE